MRNAGGTVHSSGNNFHKMGTVHMNMNMNKDYEHRRAMRIARPKIQFWKLRAGPIYAEPRFGIKGHLA